MALDRECGQALMYLNHLMNTHPKTSMFIEHINPEWSIIQKRVIVGLFFLAIRVTDNQYSNGLLNKSPLLKKVIHEADFKFLWEYGHTKAYLDCVPNRGSKTFFANAVVGSPSAFEGGEHSIFCKVASEGISRIIDYLASISDYNDSANYLENGVSFGKAIDSYFFKRFRQIGLLNGEFEINVLSPERLNEVAEKIDALDFGSEFIKVTQQNVFEELFNEEEDALVIKF